jgi:hypothetical protein
MRQYKNLNGCARLRDRGVDWRMILNRSWRFMVWMCALDSSGSGQNAEAWTRWWIFGSYNRVRNVLRRNVADVSPINKVVLTSTWIIIQWTNKTMGNRCFTILQRFFLSTNILSFLLVWRSSDSRIITYLFQLDKRMRGVVQCQLLSTQCSRTIITNP